jgi:hypothetical protein
MSICPITFNWRQVLDSSVIQVEPSYGEIGIYFFHLFIKIFRMIFKF